MNTRELKDKIFRLYDEYYESYIIASDIAYNTKLRSLNPGEVAPKRGGLFYEDNRASFNDKASDLRNEAMKSIKSALDEIVRYKTVAPSTDAVNYLMLLKNKTQVTEEEINNALTTYGDNYAVSKALLDLAGEHKLYGIDYKMDVDKIETGLNNVLTNVERWSSIDAENGLSQGSVAFSKMLIEQDIPDVTF